MANLNCQETQNLIHGYLDAELDLVRSKEIERHLHDCSICSRAYANQKALQAAIRQSVPYFKAPPDLRSRIQSAIRSRDRTPTTTRLIFDRRWLAIAASVAVTAVITWGLVQALSGRATQDRVVQDLISSHVRSLMASHLVDIESSDQHTVKPWFNGKLDFSAPVKDLTKHGFALKGGRLDYLDNRPVAALVYQRRQHVINLFIWPASSDGVIQPKVLSRQGYQLIHWTQAGLTFWTVSDLNAEELEEFVQLVKN
jgi:mycothiol system anti-sigma-R factor